MKSKKIKFYTYKLDMVFLNIFSILLLLVVGIFVYLIECHDTYQISNQVGMLLILMFFWLILHELLHALAFLLFKSVKGENITFGMFLEKGIFYCMCKQKIGKKVILTSLLFPITMIGILTLVIGMIFNQYELVLLSILNIVSSSGDIVMAIYFFKAPKDIIYLDLDDCTSFTVLSEDYLEKIKVPGIVLERVGIYDEKKMYSKDKRRLVISKASYYFILFVLILIFVNVIKI